MSAEGVRRWAVTYRRGKVFTVWAIIADVPVDVKLPEVREAVEQWFRWPQWQRRISSTGRVGFCAEGTHAWPADQRIADSEPVEQIAWATLEPEERRITVRVDSELWAACRRASAEAGLSLAEWARGVFEAAS